MNHINSKYIYYDGCNVCMQLQVCVQDLKKSSTLISNFFISQEKSCHTTASLTKFIKTLCLGKIRTSSKCTWFHNTIEFGFTTTAHIEWLVTDSCSWTCSFVTIHSSDISYPSTRPRIWIVVSRCPPNQQQYDGDIGSNCVLHSQVNLQILYDRSNYRLLKLHVATSTATSIYSEKYNCELPAWLLLVDNLLTNKSILRPRVYSIINYTPITMAAATPPIYIYFSHLYYYSTVDNS